AMLDKVGKELFHYLEHIVWLMAPTRENQVNNLQALVLCLRSQSNADEIQTDIEKLFNQLRPKENG
ncbi:MAG: hypothetical protein AAF206_17320, partial [Bacteroidota bacterium]